MGGQGAGSPGIKSGCSGTPGDLFGAGLRPDRAGTALSPPLNILFMASPVFRPAQSSQGALLGYGSSLLVTLPQMASFQLLLRSPSKGASVCKVASSECCQLSRPTLKAGVCTQHVLTKPADRQQGRHRHIHIGAVKFQVSTFEALGFNYLCRAEEVAGLRYRPGACCPDIMRLEAGMINSMLSCTPAKRRCFSLNIVFLCLANATDGVRLAARIVDTPCNEMNTDTFLEEINKVGKELGIIPTIIRDEELKTRGFGGIYGVGKAALHPPALAVLSHTPDGATQTIAWVGKGIVYDTGGLSIKGKTTMPGMKRDCGGAAAVLGAFRAAIKQGFRDNLHAVFCLAENSVGPNATRPDDIHLLYSGKTVEINNTDAEGRLVLADGVSYACKDLGADIILDMATLTGAQGIATGKYHAAVLTNSAEWEAACVKAGRKCGDLVHPLVYCPELHFSEFTSAVADMKNSVADRDNSPSSCAGLFIASHIGFDWPGVWVHLDIAAPVHAGERATGFGVALLLALFGRASEDPLLNLVSPLGCEVDVEEGDVGRDSKRRRLV
ncbi:probable aminopeptidase NPEPL1 [Theropithecus gelada]|uniref:probable aminopeptidase NPEPL1 n=1 Tax=Theropithecus gelada TaxID=9565 RepID=UPI000DC17F61|nr:probable aminopeptidase NPEPL1 [Theropithecus gelada]